MIILPTAATPAIVTPVSFLLKPKALMDRELTRLAEHMRWSKEQAIEQLAWYKDHFDTQNTHCATPPSLVSNFNLSENENATTRAPEDTHNQYFFVSDEQQSTAS